MKYKIPLYLILFLIFSLELDGQEKSKNPEKTTPLFFLTDLYQITCNEDNLSGSLFLNHSYVVCQAENRCLLKELLRKKISTTLVHRGNSFNFAASHFGYSKYGELGIRVGYAKLFGNRFALGVEFDYIFNHAYLYESVHSITFNLSFTYKINNQLLFGFSVNNPALLKRGIVGADAPLLPVIFRIDFSYLMNTHFLLFAQVEKELISYFRIRAGGSYKIGKHTALSFGVILPTPELYAGIRLGWRCIQMEIRSSYNFKTGLYPSLALLTPFSL